MTHERIWYVVMNSNRARILRGLPEPYAVATSELSLQLRHLRLRDHLLGSPTLSFSSGLAGLRSAVEPSADPLREDLLRFLHDVQDFLAAERRARCLRLFGRGGPGRGHRSLASGAARGLGLGYLGRASKNLIHLSAHDRIEVLRDTPKTIVPTG